MTETVADRKKVHRFITDYKTGGGLVRVIDPEVVHQVRRVLKLRPGEMLELCGGDGSILARLTAGGGSGLEAEIVESRAPGRPGKGTLYCAILKKDNFELAAQKATELGVAAIVPVLSRRTVKLDLNRSRLLKIIKEAAEQSGRCDLPLLAEPLAFEAALAEAGSRAVFLDGSGAPLDAAAPAPAAAFVGPEGGWEAEEAAAAAAAGIAAVSLGERVLRAETAAVVAAWLMNR